MKKIVILLLVTILALSFCACGKKQQAAQAPVAEAAPAAAEAPAAVEPEDANAAASQAVAEEQNKAGAVVGTVSQLTMPNALVVEAGGNVYCFTLPENADVRNMVAGNDVTVYFDGELDPACGTNFQPVMVTKADFAEIPEIVMVGGTQPNLVDAKGNPIQQPAAQQAPAAQEQPQGDSSALATHMATGEEIAYIWKDGSVHSEPEAGMEGITQAQVQTINFTEPSYPGPTKSCNGTIEGFIENGKYMMLDDGAGHKFLFYVEGKTVKSYDGTGLTIGANCSVMYNGSLVPGYGYENPQYVTVVNLQTDSKQFIYNIEHPRPTTNPNAPGPNSFWYGTDGKIHWYGADGRVYNYDKNGNIVLS